MHRGATQLQRLARGRTGRKAALLATGAAAEASQASAAAVIQAVVRGGRERREIQRKKQHAAVTRIQSRSALRWLTCGTTGIAVGACMDGTVWRVSAVSCINPGFLFASMIS